MLALKWDDIDLNRKTISIKRALTKGEEGWIIDTPKTEESIRKFSFPNELYIELRRHKIRQKKQNMKAGKAYTDKGYVFCKDDGSLFDPDHITRVFKKYANLAGLDFHLHELRHTFATLALQNGVDITTVSKMLGHKDVTTTLNIYSHLLPESTEKLAKTIDVFLPKRKYSSVDE